LNFQKVNFVFSFFKIFEELMLQIFSVFHPPIVLESYFKSISSFLKKQGYVNEEGYGFNNEWKYWVEYSSRFDDIKFTTNILSNLDDYIEDLLESPEDLHTLPTSAVCLVDLQIMILLRNSLSISSFGGYFIYLYFYFYFCFFHIIFQIISIFQKLQLRRICRRFI
jgi:hypothetical protein